MGTLLDKLSRDRWLTTAEYEKLLLEPQPELAGKLADKIRRKRFGTRVYLRGLIDVSSICGYDCPRCPQRTSAQYTRYRMRPREILDCCEDAWAMDVRSFLLRSGPDKFYTDKMLSDLIDKLRIRFPGCAIALALGERSKESLRALSDAGADRYILLQETADRAWYDRTHPEDLRHDRRLHCLNDLKETGYQTGCGFLVGNQTPGGLAKELKFLEEFQPQAVELVPLDADPKKVEYLLSLIRLMLPDALLCAPTNRPEEILAGANVVTQSLIRSRRSHPFCGGPRFDGPADQETLASLRQSLSEVGFEITMDPAPWNG